MHYYRVKKFDFSKTLVEAILEQDMKTKRDKVEYGTTLCTRDIDPPYTLEPGEQCTGTACSVAISEKECPVSERHLGDAHAHPTGGAEFSPGDMLGFIFHGDSIACVTGQGEMKCATLDPSKIKEIIEQYPKLVNKYVESIQPYYNEWEKTGVCPLMNKEDYDLYEEIKAKLDRFFNVDAVTLDLLSQRITSENINNFIRALEEAAKGS